MRKALDLLVGLAVFAVFFFVAYQAFAQPATAVTNPEQCRAVCLTSFSNGFENTEANLASILPAANQNDRPLLEACIKKSFCMSTAETCKQLCTQALTSKLDDTQKKSLRVCVQDKLCPGYKSPAAL
jgi:hypothetical protein